MSATTHTEAKPTAKVAAPAKEAKAPAPKKEPIRPRLPKYPDEHLITVLKPNSKARAAGDRFKVYTTGMTVKTYVEKIHDLFGRTSGQTFADMRWDEDHKFIHIGATVVEVPKEPPAEAKPTKTAA
jgi:hypothetical protein